MVPPLDRLTLASQPSKSERALGSARQARSSRPVVDRWLVDVEHPALTAVHAPLGGEILDGMVGAVSSDLEVGGVAGAAHW